MIGKGRLSKEKESGQKVKEDWGNRHVKLSLYARLVRL